MEQQELVAQEVVELKQIVEEFNQKFNAWTNKYDSRVSFGWAYSDKQIKAMEIQGIDKIVYRKPPPKSLGQIMSEAESPG